MFILVFSLMLLSFDQVRHCVNGYNVIGYNWPPLFSVPQDTIELPSYDITRWVQHLHLQQCAIVEIGEGFCALFVELRNVRSTSNILDVSNAAEFFLGLCGCATLHAWILCSSELMSQRKLDCTFAEGTAHSNTSARVHRRLCDVTLLAANAPACNCFIPLAGQQLYRTKGFPTCFRNPLPDSLCSPRGVCGIARCRAITIKGIHSPRCASDCYQRQPFCEETGSWSSVPAVISSEWSQWSPPKCNVTCGKGFLAMTGTCRDQVTGKVAVDCIGPGSFCCPEELANCFCEVAVNDGIMKATRFLEPCISTEGCTSADVQTPDLERSHADNLDETYEDYFEENPEISVPARRLLSLYSDDLFRDRSLKQRSRARNYRAVPLENDEDEDDEDEEEDTEQDNEEPDEAEEEEDTEETIGFRGHRGPRKRVPGLEPDYFVLEGNEKVNVPGKEAVKIRSVSEECDDKSTEAPQYYEYEEQNAAALYVAPVRDGSRLKFIVGFVTTNLLLAILS